MTDEVRLQDPLEFTVQIRHISDDIIKGTGIVVSVDGKILTCAHVVRDAGVDPHDLGGPSVGIYFQHASIDAPKARRANIIAYFPRHDDDVVLLKLIDGPAPLWPEQIAVLGTAKESAGKTFRSYGYRPLGQYIDGYVDGRIMGGVTPLGRNLLAKPIELKTTDIRPGMSGAGVLDDMRNLVVGIISSHWTGKTSLNTGWAVDNVVITFEPLNSFGIPIKTENYLRPAMSQPKTDKMAFSAANLGSNVIWNNAPTLLREWVPRINLLRDLTSEWVDPRYHITGLIGFGGEGKSSLARHWVNELLGNTSPLQPDGVFWWGFYDRPNVDEFFEAALNYIGGGTINASKIKSSNIRAQIIGAMIGARKYLFVLDGMEVMQHQDGDQYGLLKNPDLREFFESFASPDHNSFCLVTSRAPLLDLIKYPTYKHHDVDRLSSEEGRALLRNLGVKGDDPDLDRVVSDWSGHALTLSLISTYLTERYEGNIAHIKDIPAPTPSMDEPRYNLVDRVLRRYDEHLTVVERAFLMIFSAFRLPIDEEAMSYVFRTEMNAENINKSIVVLDEKTFRAMIARLVNYRILKHDPETKHFTVHPLIRAYYYANLKKDPVQACLVHEHIKHHYLWKAKSNPKDPLLNDLKPLIEAVHHSCSAGDYYHAWSIYRRQIDPPPDHILTSQFGAYETALAIAREFFPNGNLREDPNFKNPRRKSSILGIAGFCLMSLGSDDAFYLFKRQIEISRETKDWLALSNAYQNLARTYILLGKLELGRRAAQEGADTATHFCKIKGKNRKNKNNKNKNKKNKKKLDSCKELRTMRNSLCWLAWANHLIGNLDLAHNYFAQAQDLQRNIPGKLRYLDGFRGAQHADYLIRKRDTRHAHLIVAKSKEAHKKELPKMSRCYRLEGDICTLNEEHESALEQYALALEIAREISRKDMLIETLLSRGRFLARILKDVRQAFKDLNEALGYAFPAGYRIYEADIRVALAWAHLASGDKARAKAESEHAMQMSDEMGYYWGKMDAEEVLAALADPISN